MTSTSYYFVDNIDFDMDAVFVSDVESEMEGWVTLFASPDQGSLKVAGCSIYTSKRPFTRVSPWTWDLEGTASKSEWLGVNYCRTGARLP